MQGCTLPGLRLSAATWRLLLGQPQQAERDLVEADPQLYRSLQYLRQLAAGGTTSPAAAARDEQGDEVSAMGLHFAVHDAFGREVRGAGPGLGCGQAQRAVACCPLCVAVDGLARSATRAVACAGL